MILYGPDFFFLCVCGDLVGEWWLCSSPPSYLLGEERVGGEDLEFVVFTLRVDREIRGYITNHARKIN